MIWKENLRKKEPKCGKREERSSKFRSERRGRRAAIEVEEERNSKKFL